MATSIQHAIDIKKISASTKEELEMLCPLSSQCCIYKVAERMRRSNEHHYTPKVVSIGPIHYGKQELREMEEHKKRYLLDFLQLSGLGLEEYFELIEINEIKLRSCYAHVIVLDRETFVRMVLVDAAFVIMVLLLSFTGCDIGSFSSSNGRISQNILLEISYDMLLLENQLPFFILEDLYKLSKIHNMLSSEHSNVSERFFGMDEGAAMIIFAYNFIKYLPIVITKGDWGIKKIQEEQTPSNVEHLVALLRCCLKPVEWNPKCKAAKDINIPSIKDLYQAGVKLKVGSKEICSISNSRMGYWRSRQYQLAKIQNCYSEIFRLLRLTITSADVEFLVENKIIENRQSNAQEVSTVFHDLLHGCFIYKEWFGYTDVIDGLNNYYAVPWNKWKATWIQKYFKAPWAFFSFSAAILLLVLTIVQTVCSILQVI